jgi:hypothetical protein
MTRNRYTPREKADRKGLQEAIEHSRRTTSDGRISTTDAQTDRQKYEEGYEAIFGKREIPHGS